MNVLIAILLINLTTTVITAVSAIKRPTLDNKLIAALALAASMWAVYQMIVHQRSLWALLLTAILVITMTRQLALNRRGRDQMSGNQR